MLACDEFQLEKELLNITISELRRKLQLARAYNQTLATDFDQQKSFLLETLKERERIITQKETEIKLLKCINFKECFCNNSVLIYCTLSFFFGLFFNLLWNKLLKWNNSYFRKEKEIKYLN